MIGELSQKEYKWLLEKVGYISASCGDELMANGRKGQLWGETAITYLYKLQRERMRGIPSPQLSAKPMTFGNENEPYAIEWLRRNVNPDIKNCSEDFDEKLFRKHDIVSVGASPDAILGTPDNVNNIYEIKCVYGEKETNWMFSPTVPYAEKKAEVLKDHRNQIAIQLLVYPECNAISLMKYDPQRDDNQFDNLDPMDPSRGLVFDFTREDFGLYLVDVWKRILIADAFLKYGYNPDNINEYSYVIHTEDDCIVPGKYYEVIFEKNE